MLVKQYGNHPFVHKVKASRWRVQFQPNGVCVTIPSTPWHDIFIRVLPPD